MDLYDWISDAASPATALAYIERLENYISRFDVASARGTSRDDIRPGLRTIGFERRLTIAFTLNDADVTIQRIFYAGRNWTGAFSDD